MRRIPKDPNWMRLKQGRVDWERFKKRAAALQAVRDFFRAQDFLEIESPLLTPFPTLDCNIESIQACLKTGGTQQLPLYLHTSPEHAMKKCLAAGAERIYYLGKVFRDNEITSLHNPEFTMIEWYRTHATYRDIQADTENLIESLFEYFGIDTVFEYGRQRIDRTRPWPKKTMHSLFMEAGIDLNTASSAASFQKQARRLKTSITEKDDWETCFFKIFLDCVEPSLGSNPIWITDYPARLGLMAKPQDNNTGYVERTELYIAGIELANGYSELTDAAEQEKRFRADQKKKKNAGIDYPVDDELLHAMQGGLPPSSGMALGFDRLFMVLNNFHSIEDVLLFPVSQYI